MCTQINGHSHKFESEDGTVAWFFLLCIRKVEKPSKLKDPLFLLEPVIWITSLQTHSQKLRTADVYLLFESEGENILHHRTFFPSPRPNKLKLADFCSLIDACFFTDLFLLGKRTTPRLSWSWARSSSKGIKKLTKVNETHINEL